MDFGRRAFLTAPLSAGLNLSMGSPRLSVADFGAAPGTDNAAAGVQAAISRARSIPGSTVFFPNGTYRFPSASGNAIVGDCLEFVTLEGDQTKLFFAGTTAAMLFRNCKALTIRGLTIDWERPPFWQGEVIGVGVGNTALTVRIDREFPVDGSETITEIGAYDRDARAVKWHGLDVGNAVKGLYLLASQTVQLILGWPLPVAVGDILVLRHTKGPPVIELQKCKDTTIEEVSIYAAPAMAIVMGGCNGAMIGACRSNINRKAIACYPQMRMRCIAHPVPAPSLLPSAHSREWGMMPSMSQAFT